MQIEKDIQNTKNPQIIKIESQHPDLASNINIINYILLDLELWCLYLIFKIKRPLSTGQIYNEHLIDVYNREIHIRNIIDVVRKNIKKKEKDRSIFRKVFENESKEIDRMNKELAKLKAGDIREIEIELRKEGIKFPSYKKIDGTLQTLEDWGFITRRFEKEKLANHYWIINPPFYLKYGKQLDSKIEEKNKAQNNYTQLNLNEKALNHNKRLRKGVDKNR